MRITAISLMPICDSSAGVRFGSSRGPISSDPRFLDDTTSSIRPLSAVLGLTFLALLATDASLALLAAGRLVHCLIRALLGRFDSRCHRRLFSCRRASLLRRTQPLLAHVVIHHCLSDAFSASFGMRFRFSAHLRHIGESVLRELHFSQDVEPTGFAIPRLHDWNCLSVLDCNHRNTHNTSLSHAQRLALLDSVATAHLWCSLRKQQLSPLVQSYQ